MPRQRTRKPRILHQKVPIYPAELFLFKGTAEQAKQWFLARWEHGIDHELRSGYVCYKQDEADFGVWINPELSPAKRHVACTHEALHIALVILRYVGVDCSHTAADEALTYLHGWLTTALLSGTAPPPRR